MDAEYLSTGKVLSVKVIFNKETGKVEDYVCIAFVNGAAERFRQTHMLNIDLLQETLRGCYPTVKGPKVVIERLAGRTKVCLFVEVWYQINGLTRPVRSRPATAQKYLKDLISRKEMVSYTDFIFVCTLYE